VFCYTGNTRSFQGVKWPWVEADCLPWANAEIKNEWSSTSTPTYAFMMCTVTVPWQHREAPDTYTASNRLSFSAVISPVITVLSAVVNTNTVVNVSCLFFLFLSIYLFYLFESSSSSAIDFKHCSCVPMLMWVLCVKESHILFCVFENIVQKYYFSGGHLIWILNWGKLYMVEGI